MLCQSVHSWTTCISYSLYFLGLKHIHNGTYMIILSNILAHVTKTQFYNNQLYCIFNNFDPPMSQFMPLYRIIVKFIEKYQWDQILKLTVSCHTSFAVLPGRDWPPEQVGSCIVWKIGQPLSPQWCEWSVPLPVCQASSFWYNISLLLASKFSEKCIHGECYWQRYIVTSVWFWTISVKISLETRYIHFLLWSSWTLMLSLWFRWGFMQDFKVGHKSVLFIPISCMRIRCLSWSSSLQITQVV